MTDTHKLLAEYVANGSEGAFRELVSRYINLVYSASVRLVGGDTHLAKDVAQTVFVDLARKAGSLPAEVMLGGWLHRHACFVAAKAIRTERRRQIRERQAVTMNATNDHTEANLAQLRPFLDEAINELGAEDRMAVMLRFFEQRDFRSIGLELGTNEDAAQKRVSRALEKLESLLKRRGVACSVPLLGTVLAAEAITAAPSAMAISVSTAALAGATGSGAVGLTIMKLMTTTKFQAGLGGIVLAAAVSVPLIMQQQASARMRGEDLSLQQQADQLARIKTDSERLSNLLAANARSEGESDELRRLRAEAGTLRQQAVEIVRLTDENRELKSRFQARRAAVRTDLQIREEALVRLDYTKRWLVAFFMYADQNGERFPTNFDLALPFFSEKLKGQNEITIDQFEVVYHGPIARVAKPAETIAIREKESWLTSNDGRSWARIYGFVDGHVEIHKEPDNNFETFEKERLLPLPPGTE